MTEIANQNDNAVVSDSAPAGGNPMEQAVTSTIPLEEDVFKGRFEWIRRRKLLLAMAGATVLLAIGVTLLVVVWNQSNVLKGENSDTQELYDAEQAVLRRQRQLNDTYFLALRKAVVEKAYDGIYDPFIFLNPHAAQRLAMQWLAYKDSLHLPPYPPNATSTSTNSSSGGTVTAANEVDFEQQVQANQEGQLEQKYLEHRWIQRYALLSIYFDNDGTSWELASSSSSTESNETVAVDVDDSNPEKNETAALSWVNLLGVHECEWPLVECDDQQRVIGLDFGANGVTMTGKLSKEIGLMTNLKHLDLSQNRLKGEIPEPLYGITTLETLNLAFNEFSGELDSRIGQLKNLTTLNLRSNLMFGAVPSSLKQLTNMEYLSFGLNKEVQGPVVEYSANFHNLKHLDLQETLTSGTMPTEIGALAKLTSLDLFQSKFSGSLPTEIGNFDLVHFGIGETELVVGSIPTEIGHWTNMKSLFLHDCRALTGSIPTEIGMWTDCRSFEVDRSSLVGPIPSEIGRLTKLETIDAGTTKLTGTVPSEMGLLSNLVIIWLQYSDLTGTMPSEVCATTKITGLSINADCKPPSDTLPAKLACDCCADCHANF